MKFYFLFISLLLLSIWAQAQTNSNSFIRVSVANQMLYLIDNGEVIHEYPISTSVYGIGSEAGSNKTPLGKHKILKKFGDNAAPGTIFKSRINTGRIATIYTDDTDLDEDDVTTRIMRLTGLEPGKNKGPGVDSYARYIYIHGTPEEGLIGQPASHGCIRMKNADVIQLYDLVKEGVLVMIEP
ncbi:MAG: L,D-transpeptidase [Cyclobacteriaceae bacterium]